MRRFFKKKPDITGSKVNPVLGILRYIKNIYHGSKLRNISLMLTFDKYVDHVAICKLKQ